MSKDLAEAYFRAFPGVDFGEAGNSPQNRREPAMSHDTAYTLRQAQKDAEHAAEYKRWLTPCPRRIVPH
jgi:hypothetical protein